MFKKRSLILILFLVAIGAVFYFSKDQGVINYTLEGKKLRLLQAKSQKEWERGLMFYRKLDQADGMIFIFPDKKIRTFWNKNTYMDLDIYWIDGDKVVGQDFLPAIDKSMKGTSIVSSFKPVDKVVEIIRK